MRDITKINININGEHCLKLLFQCTEFSDNNMKSKSC